MEQQNEYFVLERIARRSPLEQDLAILGVCIKHVRPTEIMMVVRLNYDTLKQRLEILENKGLLTVKQLKKRHNGKCLSHEPVLTKSKVYVLSEKGMNLLRSYKAFLKLYQSIVDEPTKENP